MGSENCAQPAMRRFWFVERAPSVQGRPPVEARAGSETRAQHARPGQRVATGSQRAASSHLAAISGNGMTFRGAKGDNGPAETSSTAAMRSEETAAHHGELRGGSRLWCIARLLQRRVVMRTKRVKVGYNRT
jgi:hypothetical protein